MTDPELLADLEYKPVGVETRTTNIVRRGEDFYATHPFTGLVVCIASADWTPEMKDEMEKERDFCRKLREGK